MRCPHCGFADDKVIDSRIMREGEEIRRRRECVHCGTRFSTVELIVRAELKVVKRDGRREDFMPEKIRSGIEKACWKRQVSAKQIDDIVKQINSRIFNDFEREITTEQIGCFIMEELRVLDKVAYVRFASVYRDFKDVGEFIREIQTFENGVKKDAVNSTASVPAIEPRIPQESEAVTDKG